MIKFIIIILSLFLYTNILYSSEREIYILGNENVDSDIVLSILDPLPDVVNDTYINAQIKKLIETGYFKNVEITFDESKINILLDERKIIQNIEFVGNKRFKSEELDDILEIKDTLLFYNEKEIALLENKISELYKSFGYNSLDLQFSIKEYEDENFVDIIFEITENKISKISRIYFVGNKNYDRAILLDTIKSKPFNLLKFYNNSNYKEFQFKNDVIRLKNFYLDSGYKDIKINTESEFIKEKNKFNLYFYIEEGKKYKIGLLDYDIQIKDLDSEQIDDFDKNFNKIKKKIYKKDFYNQSKIINLKSEISSFLNNLGIKFYEIKTLENFEEEIVNIRFRISPIDPIYVNQINIFGNTRTKDKVIRREVTFAEGDAINDELIASTERKIQKLGFFKGVKVDKVTNEESKTDVVVDVEENQTGSFQFGVSFGTLNGTSFTTGLKEKNIGGTGRTFNLNLNTSEKNTTYALDVLEPYIFNSNINLIYGFDYRNKDLSSSSYYKINSLNFKSGVKYELAYDVNHTALIEYDIQDYNITNDSLVASSISKYSGSNAEVVLKNILSKNTMNSFINPTDGRSIYYENLVSPITNSNNGYMKNYISFQQVDQFDKNILKSKFSIGNIMSLQSDTIKNNSKFSLGGYTLRGFDSFGVGPRDASNGYIGGNNIVSSSLEFLRPLNKLSDNPIYYSLFSDAGTVWGNKEAPSNNDKTIRVSYGLGLKFLTPVGPLSLTWAFPLTDESYDKKRMFLFSIGY